MGTIGIQEPGHFPGTFLLPTWNAQSIQSALTQFQSQQKTGTVTITELPSDVYDSNGNLISSTTDDVNGNVSSTSTYAYSPDGTSVSITTKNATGGVVQSATETINLSTGAAQSDAVEYNPANATTLNEVQISGGTTSSLNASISGTSAAAYIDNAIISLAAGSQATLTGSNNTVTTGANATVGLAGNSNNDIVTTGSNGAVSVADGDHGEVVNQTGGDVTLGNNTSTTVVGSNVLISGGTGNTVSVVGNDTVNGTSDSVYLAASETVSVNGTGMVVNTSANDGVVGSNATVDVGGNLAAGQSVGVTTISGAGDVINGGTGNTIAVVGNDTVNGTNDNVYLAGNEIVTTNGTGMAVYTNTNDAIVGNGDTVDVGGNLAAGQSAGNTAVYGNNDTINAGAGNTISMVGSDTVVGTNDAVYLDGNETATTNGAGMTLYTGANANEIVVGNGDTIDAGNASLVGVIGQGTVNLSNGTVNGWTGDNLTVNGTGDTIGGGGSSTFSLTGTNDTVTASSDTIYLNTGLVVTVTGTDNVGANSDTIYASSGDNVFGNGDIIDAGNGSSIGIIGQDTVNLSNGSIGAWTGDNLTVNGTGDTIGGGGSSTFTLTGSGDTVSAGGDTVIANSADMAVTVTGNNDTIDATHDNLYLTGNETVTVNGFDTIHGQAGDVVTENLGTGSIVDSWNSSGVESSADYSGSNGTGNLDGLSSNPDQAEHDIYTDGRGSTSGYGYYGYYGFAGSASTVKAATGTNIGVIALHDLNQGNHQAAEAAITGRAQADAMAATTPTTGTGSAVLEGAKWDSKTITWSLADSAGTNAAPFSSYMGSAYDSVVQAAFATWAAATPGVTFKEVADSTQSDIRLGFGDFNAATTGVIGYTSYQAKNGQIAPDAIIRLEDPTQVVLTTGSDGLQTYADTGATLSQALLHEIGHALGLADNADQQSVMNYQLTANNRTLDSTDLSGIGSLYGSVAHAASASASVNHLIQAMSIFHADAGAADTNLLPASLVTNHVVIAASSYGHFARETM